MKILVTGGGTGGHIYPALALMNRMKELDNTAEILYVGTHRGLESTIVPEQGYMFEPLKVEGFKRDISFKGVVYNLNTVKLFLSSVFKAKKLVKRFDPDVVIGTGGYVSAPVCYAAAKLNVPTLIHEQNSVVGLTNKFLARHVSKIAICFEEAREQFGPNKDKVVYTGNPRAQEVAGLVKTDILKDYDLDPDKPTVLIFGGSRGAFKINETILDSGADLIRKPYQILFITGKHHHKSIMEKWHNAAFASDQESGNVKIVPYINNLPEVFAAVSLVVSRSGATTLAELTALGIPSILIPSPNVTEDHQTKNAKSLADKGAAFMLTESELRSEVLIDKIDQLMTDKYKRDEMGQASRALGKPNASDLIIETILKLLKSELT
ncbi:UDP-N-acetylglucosamine-N-acetylmuramylpentapeptide N-acetylglucosamine transferase [Alkalibacterium subtropicum]|uniref:UDP-N-acetylglucosamine--N-acetylmuramyl-(pentapeptide) pyrophosphoryl-undecaprenol N-acetylglucosamine transferase n=1 Tax=Alkalibacterium subtropicum TaxID=753702 RepID=A0A1I1ECJ0_9LACT|nr:undecaprenyldiphospho-muramoylpentapeptide beta-N-acetylglucosaminyltransferase [Alkalibacterium subtropicum]SFB84815.1 UDP-N-acetylglucosamine-N-acetylmuramylpentapeptide N-acetylglucosamine transferase [Alkalibacterium subtropicum]